MKKLSLSFALAILFVACNDKSDSINLSFYGLLPCADCPGIAYEIHFNDDLTFNESMEYLDREVEPFISDGTYQKNDNLLILERDSEGGFTHFMLKEDTLILLDADGKEIEGELSEYYILTKEKPDISELIDKPISEYSFQANGNEPFWNIRFGLKDKLYLRGMLGENTVSYSFPIPEAKELNEHAKSYRIENDELEMELLIRKEPCDDTMADYSYTHSASLQLKLAAWDVFQDLKGCGEYAGIYQLNNIWKLESINGEKLSENNRNAHLQFDIAEGIFYGNGGCNNISGSVEHTETTITMSRVAATQMACENLEEEYKFISKLDGFTYNIQLSKNDLTLENEENLLVFKRLE